MVLLIVHAALTWMLCGLIWTIQLVHYPLFSNVGQESFAAFEQRHRRRIANLVIPLMLMELVTALLLIWLGPDAIGSFAPWFGAALLVSIWVMTALVQAPQHARLARGYDSAVIVALVRYNWMRTLAWSGRALLVMWMLFNAM